MSVAIDDRCPRCGGGFHCGVNDDAPCPCAALQLDEAALADLRLRYDGCLCLACLREVGAAHQTLAQAPEP